MKEEIKNDLVRMPEEIRSKGAELLLKRAERDELSLVLKQQEASVIVQVEKEYEETKNKELSNATKRQAEAEARLSKDNDFTAKKEQLKQTEKDIQELSLNLEFINNKFKSARALALLIGGE
jgi:hypothetical protein